MKFKKISALIIPALLLVSCGDKSKPTSAIISSTSQPESTAQPGPEIGTTIAGLTTRYELAPNEKVDLAFNPYHTALKALTKLDQSLSYTARQQIAVDLAGLPYYSTQQTIKNRDRYLYQEASLGNAGITSGRKISLYRCGDASSNFYVYANDSDRKISRSLLDNYLDFELPLTESTEFYSASRLEAEALLGVENFIDYFPINDYTVSSSKINLDSASGEYVVDVTSSEIDILQNFLTRAQIPVDGFDRFLSVNIDFRPTTTISYRIDEDFSLQSIDYKVMLEDHTFLTSKVKITGESAIAEEEKYKEARDSISMNRSELNNIASDLSSLTLQSFLSLISTPFPVQIPLAFKLSSPLGTYSSTGNIELKSGLSTIDLVRIAESLQKGNPELAIELIGQKLTINFELTTTLATVDPGAEKTLMHLQASIFASRLYAVVDRAWKPEPLILDFRIAQSPIRARLNQSSSAVPTPPITVEPVNPIPVITEKFKAMFADPDASIGYLDPFYTKDLVTEDQVQRSYDSNQNLIGLTVDGTDSRLVDRYRDYASGTSLIQDIFSPLAAQMLVGPEDQIQSLLTMLEAIDLTKIKYLLDFRCSEDGMFDQFQFHAALATTAGSYSLSAEIGKLSLLDSVESGKYFPQV